MKLVKASETKKVSGKSYYKRVLESSFNGRVELVEEAVVEPGGKIPLHSHEFTSEFFYIASGKALMLVNGKELAVEQGDFVFVDKGEEHGFENASKEELKLLVLKQDFREGDSFLK